MGNLSRIAGWFRLRGWFGTPWIRTPCPLVGLALAAGVGILLGEGGGRCFGHGAAGAWEMGPGVACAVFFALAMLFAHAPRRPICWALVVAGFATLHLFRLNDPASTGLANELAVPPGMLDSGPAAEKESEPPPAGASAGQVLRARGVILDEPRGSNPTGGSVGAAGGKNWRFTFGLNFVAVHGRSWDCHARVVVFWRNGPESLASGERLELTGTGGGIDGPRNPGEFDLAGFLRRRGIRTEIRCGGITDVRRTPPAGWWSWLLPLPALANRFERWTQQRLTLDLGDDPEASAVISTLLLGLRSEPGLGDLEPSFQRTGTLHFFAIDGLKLGLLSVLLVRALRRAGVQRPWAETLALPLLIFYALATGLGPASVRAVLIAAVLVGGEWIGRPARSLNSLGGAAVAILGYDTNQLFDLGFQLTFLVVLSILQLGVPLRSTLIRLGAPDPFLPVKLFSPALRASESLRRKVIELVCVSCAAGLGSLPLMLIYFHVVSPISLVANVAVFPVAFGMIVLGVLSLTASVLSQTWAIWMNNANWLLAKLLLAVVRFFDSIPGGSFYAALPEWRWERPAAEITVLDLDHGARSLYLHPRGENWLIDTGRNPDYKRIVQPFLHLRGLGRIDGLVLSQADSYHLAAAPLVLTDFRPPRLFDSGLTGRSLYQRGFMKFLEQRRLSVVHWHRGVVLPCAGGTELRVLYPPDADPPGRAAGDKALVLQLRAAGWRVLLLGDGGSITRQWLAQHEAPEALRSDVLITGSSWESLEAAAPDFLRAVAPRLIVQASPKTPGRLMAPSPLPTLSAARSGAITLRIYPWRIEASGFVDGESINISR